MTTNLRAMLASEYASFLEYFVTDYAEEIAANYDLSIKVALEQAKREVTSDLPQGLETKGQVLLCIESEPGNVVGYLWYQPDSAAQSAFINDFYIFRAYRGRGFGSAALVALEVALGKTGLNQIRLRVAASNERARHVYEASGFRVTGINMSKNISQ